MKKVAVAIIATTGLAIIAFAEHDVQAAEQGNSGYNSNDTQSYSYTYTIDTQGNYYYTWIGNRNSSQLTQNSTYYYNNYNVYSYNNVSYNSYYNHSYQYNSHTNNNQTTTNNYYTDGLGASYSATGNNVYATTTAASSSNSHSISNGYASGSNLYTSGQYIYYAFDCVGGKIGSTWGSASNWANVAVSSDYTVNDMPKVGAIMQTTQGYYGHVVYVEGVNNNGFAHASEMNYGHGVGAVTSRVISTNQAGSYSFIH